MGVLYLRYQLQSSPLLDVLLKQHKRWLVDWVLCYSETVVYEFWDYP
jgi:hypothetical protein